MKRRHFLVNSMLATLGISCGGPGMGNSNNDPIGPDNDIFSTPFALPPELHGKLENGKQTYELNLQKGETEFIKGSMTPTWGINTDFLGPTLRINNGDEVALKYTNSLSEDTTIHGHGLHLPAKMDGGPHQIIKPNKSWTSSFTVKQHASTNWYHPHLMGKTADHVIMGLAGLIIIDDEKSKALDLPKDYGEDDFPMVVQDRSFHSDGSFDYEPTMRERMRGWRGKHLMVNGVIRPLLELPSKEIRFRILNGSNSRIYRFAFVSGKSFHQIATDSAFLEKPVKLKELQLSPGERAEIVVDFTNDLNKEEVFTDLDSGKNVMKVHIKNKAIKTTSLPKTLVTLPFLDRSKADVDVRRFALTGGRGELSINDKEMALDVINERVPLNNIEIWEIENEMDMDHNFHIHATHFEIISRNGREDAVADNETGFKDTVYIPPKERVKIIVKMIDYKDDKSPYMYHCHILEHEDMGMMGQFVVV